MRRTKIVATIGPASEKPEVLERLIQAGMNVARLNFSHGSQADHLQRIEMIRAASAKLGTSVAILIDLRGPEIRLGLFEGGKINLVEGETFTLTTVETMGTEQKGWVQYPGIVNDVRPGSILLMDDGNLTVECTAVTATEVVTRVIVGGPLSDRKKVNLPGVRVSLPAIDDKDVSDIRFGVANGVDFVAGSFIQSAADVLAIRRVIEEAGGNQHIIAKVESGPGFEALDEILEVADGLMVARGDLGVEVPTEEVPLMQKKMIAAANAKAKPVITATQMLESMVTKPRPTRAEAGDVANAIFDGTDAVMLSAESATGAYPVDAVRTMAQIAKRTEEALDYAGNLTRKRRIDGRLSTVTEAISYATVSSAHDLGARAIITATRSGFTARMVSKHRPQAPIIAVTPDESSARKLQLSWGVFTVIKDETDNTDKLIDRAVEGALDSGHVENGDLVVITAGVPVGITGTTNLLKVHTVGDVLVRGQAIGKKAVTGRARIVLGEAGFAKVKDGDILVATVTDAEFVPTMERVAAIITEEGGLTSHAAIVGLSLGKAVIVGAEGATTRIADGQLITVDGFHGLVYRGKATVK